MVLGNQPQSRNICRYCGLRVLLERSEYGMRIVSHGTTGVCSGSNQLAEIALAPSTPMGPNPMRGGRYDA